MWYFKLTKSTSSDVLPVVIEPSKLLRIAQAIGDQVFKCLNLQGTFLIRTTTGIKDGAFTGGLKNTEYSL